MSRISMGTLIAIALLAAAVPAGASLILTAAGVSDGFTFTTFVSGYSAQYGPLARASPATGM
jgi:hypothetical protein